LTVLHASNIMNISPKYWIRFGRYNPAERTHIDFKKNRVIIEGSL